MSEGQFPRLAVVRDPVVEEQIRAFIDGKTILVTGGTGSFGKTIIKAFLTRFTPKKVICFSRDELKQFEMQQMPDYNPQVHRNLRFFIGDVRDYSRLKEAFRGVDLIVHAAALKQVPAVEYNPFEGIKTNVLGAHNIITAALESRVKNLIALSTDKAANPVNLYGATKLCSDKLFIAANQMAGDIGTKFSVVRYGNVVASRGSVFPFFRQKAAEGSVPITDERMTRFSITLEQGVEFVLRNFVRMQGGEIFIPKIPSYRIMDVAEACAPGVKTHVVGIRPGEKLHEIMVPVDEARSTIEFEAYFVIEPTFGWWEHSRGLEMRKRYGGKAVHPEFSYASNTNDQWLSLDELKYLAEVSH